MTGVTGYVEAAHYVCGRQVRVGPAMLINIRISLNIRPTMNCHMDGRMGRVVGTGK